MNNDQTLLFIGAGASASYGIPCGNQLVEEICEDVLIESDLKIYLRDEIGHNGNDLEDFGQTFKAARNTTIDEFLETQNYRKDLARHIIGAKLITYENHYLAQGNKDWLSIYLKTLLSRIKTYNEALTVLSKVIFYTLNYDRSVEYILYSMLKARYYIRNDDVLTIEQLLIDANRVIHRHGSLGQLALDNIGNGRPYERDFPDPEKFKSICKNIKFWDDESNNPNDHDTLNESIRNSKKIYFLGFGFHKGILERFKPNILSNKIIYCTVKGAGLRKWEEIVTFLRPGIATIGMPPLGTTVVDKVRFGKEDQTCDNFFKEIFIE